MLAVNLDGLHHLLVADKRKVNSIWVVVDCLTKRCHFVTTTKAVTTEGIAQRFVDHILKLHGIPTSIVSKFDSACWQLICKSVETRLGVTATHCAQGDGQTERMNCTLEESYAATLDLCNMTGIYISRMLSLPSIQQ
ncbi:Retrovirus Polyprotein [Phytophthora palmivora]|uniref:Retrovirus Polyprotein n=1 Tax=Phytophthora palmivora TaxID=4796 RepID=A0A2P4YVT6_9STRA|nr:Retrovirus Polyprotein [Phytophthora palmivora]